MTEISKFCLVGIPDDLGVKNVGGRIGASKGPEAFRSAFFKLRGRTPVADQCVDLGDTQVTSSIESNHDAAAQIIKEAHEKAPRSLVVGGGHDHGYSHLLGVKKGRLGCINLDAHLDVRKSKPVISSGSPFYLAIENKVLRGTDLIEFGIQGHCNAKDLWEYAKKNKVPIHELHEIRRRGVLKTFNRILTRLHKSCDRIVVQLDLDCIAEAHAPGVSAPQPDGFTPGEIYDILRSAKKSSKVCSLGIFELNPEHDRNDVTAKIAAQAAYYFLGH